VEDGDEYETGLGAIDTRLLVTHILCWVAIAAMACHGVRSLGLLAPYVCVLPSICLCILVIAVLGVSGAHDSLHRIVYWQTDLWIDAEVWCWRARHAVAVDVEQLFVLVSVHVCRQCRRTSMHVVLQCVL
jgi:hypothetical protein